MGLPALAGRIWMASTGLDDVYSCVREEVEEHLRGIDALCVGMDGWQNEKNGP